MDAHTQSAHLENNVDLNENEYAVSSFESPLAAVRKSVCGRILTATKASKFTFYNLQPKRGCVVEKMERETGFEPATSTLAI